MNKLNGNGSSQVKEARIKCEAIFDSPFPNELIATVNSSQGLLTIILSSSYVNRSQKTISATIIDERPDSYMIDLPTYTITSGSRAWLLKKFVEV